MLKIELKNTLDELLTIGPRAPGSWDELKAAKFINAKFESFGYDSQIKKFRSASHNATDAFLEVEEESFYVLPTQFSHPGEVSGELVYLGNCSDPFYLKNNVKGKIGILFPSESFADRLNFLLEIESKGMLGLIVISSHKDVLETKSIRFNEIKTMPIAVTSWDIGNKLVGLVGNKAKLKVNWRENPRNNESQNVIATLPGSSPYWMVVTAHHDSAAYAPGAMDNGGGSAMLVELARSFAGKQFPATVYFVSTGSEENGGMDSCGAGLKAFFGDLKDQLDTCIGHIEIDDIGNILGIPQIFYRGNKPFMDLLFDKKVDRNYKITKKDFFSCDNGVSAKYGLPFVWFTDAALHPRPWYHTPDDTKDKMCVDKCAIHFEFISKFIEKLANSKPFYPYIKQNDLLIRPARFEDIDAVKEITKAAFGPVSVGRMSEDFFGKKLGGIPWHEHKNRGIEVYFNTHLNLIIVCEKNGVVVGYASAGYDRTTMVAEIGNNAVHPDFQRQGIGKAMQMEIARRMEEEGFKHFTVQTLSCDISAQRIYEKLGYKKIESNIIYLKNKETKK